MRYLTASEGRINARALRPQYGESVDGTGNYPGVRRHAYVEGDLETLCGIELVRLPGRFPHLGWGDGGCHPRRCEECTELATEADEAG